MPWGALVGTAGAMHETYRQLYDSQNRAMSANQLRSLADLSNNLAASEHANAYNGSLFKTFNALAPAAQAVKRQQDAYNAALQNTRIDVLWGLQTIRPSYTAPLDMREPSAKAEPDARPKVTPDEARRYRAVLFPRWKFDSPFRGLELWLYKLVRRYA